MRQGASPRIGLFGIGLAAYWPQFEGLRERLEVYQRRIEARLEAMGAEVVSAGLVDTAPAARQAGANLAAAGVDLVMLYTATYATSSQVLPTVQAAGAPVVILNLQPTRTLDYDGMTTGEWLANCSACCVPELAGALTRSRIPYRTVTGTLVDDDPAWDALRDWLDATRAVRSLRSARIGFLGHTYPGMLDMYSDFTQVHAQTGAHVEVLEIDDLVMRVESADEAAVERKGQEIRETFDLMPHAHGQPGREQQDRDRPNPRKQIHHRGPGGECDEGHARHTKDDSRHERPALSPIHEPERKEGNERPADAPAEQGGAGHATLAAS